MTRGTMLTYLQNRWCRLVLSILICCGLPALACCFSGKIDVVVVLMFLAAPVAITAFGCVWGMQKESGRDWFISLVPALVSVLVLAASYLMGSGDGADTVRFVGFFALLVSALHFLQMRFFAIFGRRDLLVSWWVYVLGFVLCTLVGYWGASLMSVMFWISCAIVSLLCILLVRKAERKKVGAGVGVAVWVLFSGLVMMLLHITSFTMAESAWKVVVQAVVPGIIALLVAMASRKKAQQDSTK